MDYYSIGFSGSCIYGKAIRRIAPKGGINETSYVEVNGQEMWISIYGKDVNNPVLLYLHGGLGYSSSYADYAILDQLADDYTIVNWDQRSGGSMSQGCT